MSDSGVTVTTEIDDADPRTARCTVAGDFDGTQIERFEQALEALSHDVAVVTIDISGCTVLDSAAIGSLINLRRLLVERGGALITVADRPFQRLILHDTGLAAYLGLVE